MIEHVMPICSGKQNCRAFACEGREGPQDPGPARRIHLRFAPAGHERRPYGLL